LIRRLNVRKIIFSILCLWIVTLFTAQLQAESRDTWQQPEKIMDAVGVKPGMIIGELGAGEGYFTFRLSRRVGPKGKIYANDIVKKCLDTIRKRCQRENITNIETILGQIEDPLLPQGKMDMVIMVYAFHHFEKPVVLLKNLQSSLKPGAAMVIVERDPERFPGYNPGHFSTREEVLKQVKQAGFELSRIETFLPRDNIYIFHLSE